MATLHTNDLKKGVTILFKDDVYTVVGVEFVSPGKGSAFTRTRLKSVKTGNVIEHTYKNVETIEEAPTEPTDMQFLYSDDSGSHFMDTESYEQHAVDKEIVGDATKVLKEGEQYVVTMYEGRPIALKLPAKVRLKITDAEPNVKGDTATSAQKNATLETGAQIRVPVFINTGETVVVNTETGEYVERAK